MTPTPKEKAKQKVVKAREFMQEFSDKHKNFNQSILNQINF